MPVAMGGFMLLVSPVRWWVIALQALLNLFFGVFAILSPQLPLFDLVYAFACLALINGLAGFSVALRERHFLQRWWMSALIGLINLGMGLFVICYNSLVVQVSRDFLSVFIGIQALFQGSISFGVSLEMNRVFKVKGAFIFYGILSICGGILVLAAPYASMVDLFTLIATYAILAAIGQALDSLRLRRMSIY